MQRRPLGHSGIQASIVGFGAWVTGGGIPWGENPDDAESIRAIHASIDAGINLIDTAPAYGWGRSEQIVGRAIKGRRDQVVLATKCGLWWEDQRGSFFADLDGKPVRRSLRPDTLQIEIENSLRRLGVDCIDLYQTHWPSAPPDFTPIADSVATLLKFKDQGKIRAIGVSNVSLDELKENRAHAPIVSDQFRYSILNRAAEKDILPYCRENGLATLAYMALEQGLLTGKVGMDRLFSKDEFRSNAAWNPWFLLKNRKRVLDLLEGWRALAAQHQCSLAQLVLAWTASQPGMTHVLAGARTTPQALDNAAAGKLKLDASTLAQMRRDADALGQPETEVNS